jgi:hypothetical protein
MAGVMERKELKNNPTEAKQAADVSAQLKLADYLDGRPEIGFYRMLVNLALEPREPFKPDGRRTARKGFVVALVFAAAFVAWFVWFNVIR